MEPDAIDMAQREAIKGKRPSPYAPKGLSGLRRAIDPKEHAAAQMFGRMSPFHRNQAQLLDEFESEERAYNYQRNMAPVAKGKRLPGNQVQYNADETKLLYDLVSRHAKEIGAPAITSLPEEEQIPYFWDLVDHRRQVLMDAYNVQKNRAAGEAIMGPRPPVNIQDWNPVPYYDLSKVPPK